MKVYLIRHPQPLDVDGLCYGRREVALAPEALASAVTAVRARIDAHTLQHGRFCSSPATRCRLLAHALAAPRTPTLVDELQEMDFGTWEGKPWDAVPRDEVDAWAGDVWRYRPGGAESAALVAERWLRWSRTLRESSGTILAVTHAGLIRVALRCSGVLSAAEFSRAVIGFGSVHCIELEARAPA